MPTAMTAERFYVDSSALRQLYVHDAHSVAMAAWRFRNPGLLGLTRFGRVELINSIASAVFRRGSASPREAAALAPQLPRR
jgi:hypothetical protein